MRHGKVYIVLLALYEDRRESPPPNLLPPDPDEPAPPPQLPVCPHLSCPDNHESDLQCVSVFMTSSGSGVSVPSLIRAQLISLWWGGT